MSEIELHRKLLGDAVRNRAFEAALKAHIVPGVTTVADLGAGTGYLSFLARRLGAKHCTLVEYSEALSLARALAREHGIDGLRFIEGHSAEIANPPKVDLVVSETLGNCALEEGLLETLVDARRYLKPGGRLIPARLWQYAAPVRDPELQAEIDVWPRIDAEWTFAAARRVGLNNAYVRSIRPDQLGAEGRCWDALDFSPERPAPPSRRQQRLRWEGPLEPVHGFALWWVCELAKGVTLSTAPDAPPTHWQQIYLPLLKPVLIEAGDALELDLGIDTRREVGFRLQWQALHRRAGKVIAEQRLDSFRGRL